jgi:tRNA(Ser,Leu) C12 N-acetylase TAN1
VPGARVRSSGFRGVFAVEAEGDPVELATFVWDECAEKVGHVTAVLAMVESTREAIKDAACRFGAEQIGPQESFCFRVHKRGAHRLEQDTSELEREIGAAIWTALEEKYRKTPRVNLKNPDITVIAEILGPLAAIGIARRSWRGSVSVSDMDAILGLPDVSQ